jgi:hypothetical protein
MPPDTCHLTPGTCFSPEDRLLLLLCRGRVSADQEAEARELLLQPAASSLQPAVSGPQPTAHSPQPHWSRIIARAIEQEILPLFRRNLETLGFPGVPADARARMNDLCRTNTARQLFLVEELRRLLRLLDSAGIPAIPLKGPWLAQRLYGDYTLRVCADLDLMVPPGDALEAIRLVAAAGYSGALPERLLTGWLLDHSIEYPLTRREPAITCGVELHWKLWDARPSACPATSDMWAEALPSALLGAPAYALSPEWELLHLCVHAAQHQWQSLKWLADINEICCSGGIDWGRVREKADRFRLAVVVELTLAACRRLFGTFDREPLPAGFRLALLPRGVRLFPAPGSAYAALRMGFAYSRLMPGVWEKLRCLAEIVFVPRLADRQAVALPASLGFLYYPLRPLRLALKWIGVALKVLPKSAKAERCHECYKPTRTSVL